MAVSLPDNRVIIACLALVVLVALSITGWSVHQAVSPPPPPTITQPTYSFLCDKCGALFDLPQSALSKETVKAMNTPQGAAVDCPKCGAKACAYVPTRCPACGKYYISDSARGLPPSPSRPARCPHCGVDPIVWQLQHVKPEV